MNWLFEAFEPLERRFQRKMLQFEHLLYKQHLEIERVNSQINQQREYIYDLIRQGRNDEALIQCARYKNLSTCQRELNSTYTMLSTMHMKFLNQQRKYQTGLVLRELRNVGQEMVKAMPISEMTSMMEDLQKIEDHLNGVKEGVEKVVTEETPEYAPTDEEIKKIFDNAVKMATKDLPAMDIALPITDCATDFTEIDKRIERVRSSVTQLHTSKA